MSFLEVRSPGTMGSLLRISQVCIPLGSSGDGPLLRALVAGQIPFQWFVAEGWSPPFLQAAQSPLALQPELNECLSLQTPLT